VTGPAGHRLVEIDVEHNACEIEQQCVGNREIERAVIPAVSKNEEREQPIRPPSIPIRSMSNNGNALKTAAGWSARPACR